MSVPKEKDLAGPWALVTIEIGQRKKAEADWITANIPSVGRH
jgi:hypothetical protein